MYNSDTLLSGPVTHPAISSVRLSPGTPFYDRQSDMNEFLLEQDADQMLYNFRKAAGLPLRGAKPMTGWDAEDCKLKGHTTGHYMSALSLACAAASDESVKLSFRRKLEYMIGSLAECQAAFSKLPGISPGFLSAYDEEQFDLLEVYTKYPEIWAPYYTLDKILAGLLDAYEFAGIDEALRIAEPIGIWVDNRLSRLPDEQRQRMWSMYIAGEYGGMIEALIRLSRFTGRKRYLGTSRLFENPALFEQMAEGRDELDTMHANQHIPQIIGALELYAETQDPQYLDIASNFERIVTGHHSYAIGGVGEEERFHAPDSELEYLTEKTAESCASVNMLRLTGRLHEFTPSHALMDHYERTLFNHILMSFSRGPDGGTTYFLPLAPGSSKYYEREENSCCHGTGLESRYRYMRDIYSYNSSILRVELPVSSHLTDPEDITLTYSDDGVLTVKANRTMKRALAIRIPDWAEGSFTPPRILFKKIEYSGGYLILPEGLKDGEEIRLSLKSGVRKIFTGGSRGYFTLARGPYLLAEISDDKEIRSPSGEEDLVPLFSIDDEHYHIYFRK